MPASRRSSSRPATRSSCTTWTGGHRRAPGSASRAGLERDPPPIGRARRGARAAARGRRRSTRSRPRRTSSSRRPSRTSPSSGRSSGRSTPRPPPATILATNTSALSVAAIAAAARARSGSSACTGSTRSRGCALVEVVGHPRSPTRRVDPRDCPRDRLGQDPGPLSPTPRASSSTGSTGRSPSRRCACSRRGAATVAAIDAALRGAGFPMGPFELMDLIGLDVNLAAATAVWDGSRATRSACGRRRSRRGSSRPADLGRKTGVRLLPLRRRPGGRRPTGRVRGRGRRRPCQEAAIVERIVAPSTDEARLAVADGVAERGRHRPRPAARGRPSARSVRARRRSSRVTVTSLRGRAAVLVGRA